jgi:hypothetical protein
MKLLPVPAGVRYIGVALLFAICGACSEFFLTTPHSAFPNGTGMLPIPFALLCAILFLRQWRAIIAVPLMVVVWAVASLAATNLFEATGGRFLAFGCAGFIGGFGLVLCVATCHGRLLARKYIFGGQVIGAVSALAFVPSVSAEFPHQSAFRLTPHCAILDHLHLANSVDAWTVVLLFAYAIWQAAVGTYLYKIVRDTSKEARPQDSPD